MLFSIATHPVLVFYGVCCYLSATGVLFPPFQPWAQAYTLGLILLTTVLIPVMGQYWVSRSLFMEERQQRLAPLLVTGLCYFLAWLVFKMIHMPSYLLAFLFSLTLGLGGLYGVTRFYKLSVHTSAAGSMVALFFSFIRKQAFVRCPLSSGV